MQIKLPIYVLVWKDSKNTSHVDCYSTKKEAIKEYIIHAQNDFNTVKGIFEISDNERDDYRCASERVSKHDIAEKDIWKEAYLNDIETD